MKSLNYFVIQANTRVEYCGVNGGAVVSSAGLKAIRFQAKSVSARLYIIENLNVIRASLCCSDR